MLTRIKIARFTTPYTTSLIRTCLLLPNIRLHTAAPNSLSSIAFANHDFKKPAVTVAPTSASNSRRLFSTDSPASKFPEEQLKILFFNAAKAALQPLEDEQLNYVSSPFEHENLSGLVEGIRGTYIGTAWSMRDQAMKLLQENHSLAKALLEDGSKAYKLMKDSIPSLYSYQKLDVDIKYRMQYIIKEHVEKPGYSQRLSSLLNMLETEIKSAASASGKRRNYPE